MVPVRAARISFARVDAEKSLLRNAQHPKRAVIEDEIPADDCGVGCEAAEAVVIAENNRHARRGVAFVVGREKLAGGG